MGSEDRCRLCRRACRQGPVSGGSCLQRTACLRQWSGHFGAGPAVGLSPWLQLQGGGAGVARQYRPERQGSNGNGHAGRNSGLCGGRSRVHGCSGKRRPGLSQCRPVDDDPLPPPLAKPSPILSGASTANRSRRTGSCWKSWQNGPEASGRQTTRKSGCILPASAERGAMAFCRRSLRCSSR